MENKGQQIDLSLDKLAIEIRRDFPIFTRTVNGKNLVYLDNAATSQKPFTVLDSLSNFYKNNNANVHRGVHQLSIEATDLYEAARLKIADFIKAKPEEIIFVRNASEAINLAVYAWGNANIGSGDEILISPFEHHSNLVPWQQLVKRNNALLKYIELNRSNEVDLDKFKQQISPKTKLIAVTQMSNVDGTRLPIVEISKIAKSHGVKILLDSAQGIVHDWLDVAKMDVDFAAFSGHKLYGPTGIGVLYAKKEVQEEMQPLYFGGDMVKEVTYEDAIWNDAPYKFEAGTPNFVDAVALSGAIDYIKRIGLDKIQSIESALTNYAVSKLKHFPNLNVFTEKSLTSGVISFTIKGVHPHDIASILDSEGVEIRAGYLCAQPYAEKIASGPVSRMSFAFYNTLSDVDAAISGIQKVYDIFRLK